MSAASQSAWRRALDLADATPPTRNRYADFLRAASISVVVLGHWLMAAPHRRADGVALEHMLDVSSWTHWLTWLLQVMPIFFIVGGFSNSISWEKARERGLGYAEWLDSRLRRLVMPVLPLLLVWGILGSAAILAKIRPETLRAGSQIALVPTWFLCVYLVSILTVPWTHAAWRRFGMGSFAALAVLAAVVDLAAFAGGMKALRWLNYLFVWSAVHQLGYAWRSRRLEGWRRVALAGFGLAALFALVLRGPYPVSMVGVPGEEVSNSLPPTVALLALGMFQGGLLLTFEPWVSRWLERRRVWAATVLVNANIMTLYLWHSTVLVLVIGLLVRLNGLGLGLAPGTGTWWWSRIPWVLALAALLLPVLALFGRFERPSARPGPPPAAWRLIVAALLFCGGVAILAYNGVGGGRFGLRIVALALPFAGAALAQFGWRRGSSPT